MYVYYNQILTIKKVDWGLPTVVLHDHILVFLIKCNIHICMYVYSGQILKINIVT